MAYIRKAKPEEVTGPLKPVYDNAIKRAGGVAQIIQVMSLDGHVAGGSMNFYVSLMKRPNALDAATREMIAAVTSNVNDCYY